MDTSRDGDGRFGVLEVETHNEQGGPVRCYCGAPFGSDRRRTGLVADTVDPALMPSRPGELHPDGIRPDFSATLTTMAFDHSSLRWLEINT